MLCVCERVTDLWAVFQVAATARMASLQVSLFRRRSFWHKLPKLTISHQSARRGLALSQLSVLARNTCGLLPERAPSTADQVPPPLPPPPRRLRLPDATFLRLPRQLARRRLAPSSAAWQAESTLRCRWFSFRACGRVCFRLFLRSLRRRDDGR